MILRDNSQLQQVKPHQFVPGFELIESLDGWTGRDTLVQELDLHYRNKVTTIQASGTLQYTYICLITYQSMNNSFSLIIPHRKRFMALIKGLLIAAAPLNR